MLMVQSLQHLPARLHTKIINVNKVLSSADHFGTKWPKVGGIATNVVVFPGPTQGRQVPTPLLSFFPNSQADPCWQSVGPAPSPNGPPSGGEPLGLLGRCKRAGRRGRRRRCCWRRWRWTAGSPHYGSASPSSPSGSARRVCLSPPTMPLPPAPETHESLSLKPVCL